MTTRTECTMQMKLVHDTLIRLAAQQFSEHDMTFSQVSYLEYLVEQNHPVPLKELEQVFRVSQPTVVGIVKRLRQKGLVVLEQSEQDYKSKNVVLTEAGCSLYDASQEGRKALEERMYRGFSAEDVQAFSEMFARVYRNLTSD